MQSSPLRASKTRDFLLHDRTAPRSVTFSLQNTAVTLPRRVIQTNLSTWMDRIGTRDVSKRHNRRHYEQLSDFERRRILSLTESGWSNRRVGHRVGRSDMAVARFWLQWITKGLVYLRGGSGVV
ncbi:hypothetical protein TNCV_4896201 [Trichonephila clavipes]|uniref:Transposase IS30-like HTH domain-containing protein n=1 Tax=Trichonephila clavipes TaxID=2585209 RepID=A0A8X6VWV5_TRICX|nr:hypothetical protein TNCV_4896201 [Trichonephila clavipes]